MNTLYALVGIITMLLQILIWIIVIQAILSWLVAFNVINVHNQYVRTVLHALERITEPLLRPIRRFMPDLGGIDFSPMVLIIHRIAVQRLLTAELVDTGALRPPGAVAMEEGSRPGRERQMGRAQVGTRDNKEKLVGRHLLEKKNRKKGQKRKCKT